MNRAQVLSALPGGLVAAVLLLLQLPADPPAGLTFSESPWTDEAWSVVGARNLVLLGTWTTDELALHLVQLPYQLAVTVVFEAFGVGIVQARALSVALTVGAVVLTALTTTRHFGAVGGTVAGVGLAASPLMLYYGRLAYLEPMVTLCLAAGAAILLARPGLRPIVAGAAAGACLALAIGTKPSAIAAAAGILVGGGLAAGGRLPGVRATLVAGVSVIVVAAVGWATLIGLPQREAIETVFRFWPAQPLPETLVDWVVRVGRYVRASDGANLLTLPLIVGGVAGTLLALRRWHTLEPGQRMLVGAAAGWVVLGMLLIVMSAYRPNRYVVPLLPALAMLSGVAAGLMLERLQPRRTFAAAAAVAAVMAAPGLVLWAGWQASATHRLPAIQAQVAQVIGAQGAVEGGVGVGFAMRAPVPTIVSRPALGINAGDLYAAHGVRWVVADDGYQPTWAGAHPEAWRAREVVACFVWGPDGTECLIRLP